MSNQTYATPTSGAQTGATTYRPRPTPSPRRDSDTGPRSRTTSLIPRRNPDVGPPRLRQLIGICGWAAMLGGIGLVIGVRGLLGVLTSATVPGWYEPLVILDGMAGIGLTVGAFLNVRRGWLPFALLTGSTALLLGALALTSNAF